MEACICLCDAGDGPDMNDALCEDYDPEYGDGEMLYFDQVVTADKELTCLECGCKIAPGKKYERVDARYDGDWTRFDTCIGCMRVRNDLFHCGFIHGAVWENLYDAWLAQLDPNLSGEEYDRAIEELCALCP